MGLLSQEDQACCADNVDLYHPFVLVNLKKPVEDRYLVVERFLGPDFLSRDPQYGEVDGDLAFDGASGLVVATEASKGSIAFDLDGVGRHEWPEPSSDSGRWFFPERQCFARPAEGMRVEERAFLAG